MCLARRIHLTYDTWAAGVQVSPSAEQREAVPAVEVQAETSGPAQEEAHLSGRPVVAYAQMAAVPVLVAEAERTLLESVVAHTAQAAVADAEVAASSG